MKIQQIIADNKTDVFDVTAAMLRESGARAVVLVPDAAAQRVARDAFARRGVGFGNDVQTWGNWIRGKWEFLGDGRALADGTLRTMICLQALVQLNELPPVLSYAKMLGRIASQQGLSVAEAALPEGAPEQYVQLQAALQVYAQLLADHGFVEPVEALAYMVRETPQAFAECPVYWLPGAEEREADALLARTLSEADVPVVQVVHGCRRASDVAGAERPQELVRLLEALPFAEKSGAGVVEREGVVHLAMPSGPVAEPRALIEICTDAAAAAKAVGGAPVVLVAPKPAETFRAIGSALAARGVGCRVEDSVVLNDTPVGGAFRNLLYLLFEDEPSSRSMVDFAMNPCSGLSGETARKLDRWIRRDRVITVDKIVTALSESPVAKTAIEALQSGKFAAAVDALATEGFRALGAGDVAERQLLSRGAEGLCGIAEAAEHLGLGGRNLMKVLDSLGVRFSAAYGEDVRICTMAQAAALPAGSAHTVILSGMISENWPAKTREQMEDGFLEAVGIAKDEDVLTASRRLCFDALDCAFERVILERVQTTLDAKPAYSALSLEELLDCYRPDPTDSKSLDRSGLPLVFTKNPGIPLMFPLGEDEVTCNTNPAHEAPREAVEETSGVSRAMPKPADEDVVFDPELVFGEDPVLSASAINSFLNCPYKWFVEKRLHVDSKDAGFTPLERGTFIHDVLREGYRNLQGAGMPRVTKGNLEEARKIVGRVFDAHAQADSEASTALSFAEFREKENTIKPGYVPVNAFEEDALRVQKKDLLEGLAVHAELYPDFTPTHFELDFGKDEDHPVMYAGVRVIGTIDRIDVDEEGHAVILDYKGRAKNEYMPQYTLPVPHLLVETPVTKKVDKEEITVMEMLPLEVPGDIQTLLYAQIARREFGLTPVAALYLSYGSVQSGKAMVAGSYTLGFAPPERLLPGKSVAVADSPETFAEFLDEVEEKVAMVLEPLKRGECPVSPRIPLTKQKSPNWAKSPCKYCVAISCPNWKKVSRESFNA